SMRGDWWVKFRIADCGLRIWDGNVIRGILSIIEIALLSALILATRCANYQDVFVAGNVYFVDADCYARMTRVRMCHATPRLIVLHHTCEHFPQWTIPHTTAPLDYLILGLSLLLNPFTAHTLDLAGAFISPLLALLGGWFLWWWSRRMKFRYRWVMLVLYAISPILVQGTELGRPDHQSLSVLLVTIALLIERRVPSLSIFHPDTIFKNWASTIGELAHVSPANPIWLRWCGYFLLVTPFLIWFGLLKTKSKSNTNSEPPPLFVVVLLCATYALTIWQARWGYFFVLILALALPALLEPIKSRAAVWIAFVLSIFPILRDWDERLWPNDAQLAMRIEQRNESMQIRDLALNLQSSEMRAFLAPWWLSPSIAYWSGQPGIAGSSHESLSGIEDSARFFLSEDLQKAREILKKREAAWVF